jgi:hypothetical protein
MERVTLPNTVVPLQTSLKLTIIVVSSSTPPSIKGELVAWQFPLQNPPEHAHTHPTLTIHSENIKGSWGPGGVQGFWHYQSKDKKWITYHPSSWVRSKLCLHTCYSTWGPSAQSPAKSITRFLQGQKKSKSIHSLSKSESIPWSSDYAPTHLLSLTDTRF